MAGERSEGMMRRWTVVSGDAANVILSLSRMMAKGDCVGLVLGLSR